MCQKKILEKFDSDYTRTLFTVVVVVVVVVLLTLYLFVFFFVGFHRFELRFFLLLTHKCIFYSIELTNYTHHPKCVRSISLSKQNKKQIHNKQINRKKTLRSLNPKSINSYRFRIEIKMFELYLITHYTFEFSTEFLVVVSFSFGILKISKCLASAIGVWSKPYHAELYQFTSVGNIKKNPPTPETNGKCIQRQEGRRIIPFRSTYKMEFDFTAILFFSF